MSQEFVRELGLQIKAGWRVLAVESAEEERAIGALKRAAKACEKPLVRWTVASGLDDGGAGAGSFDDGLRAISARPDPAVFCVLDAQRLLGDVVALRRLRDLCPLLAERGQVLALVGPYLEIPTELEREVSVVQLPLPQEAELTQIFARHSTQPDPDVLAAAVRAALGLTGSEAVRILRKSCALAGGLNAEAVATIVREKRQSLRRTHALSFHEPTASLDDVGGLDELKRWLRDRRRAFSDEARQFGLPTPRGLLLLGVQGCGKSMSSKAVAAEWQFPLLRLDLAAAFGSAEQSPEAAMRDAIEVAESIAPAVLWIDEIEKGFSAAGGDARSARTFGAFLTWLAEKTAPVFVVATANDISALPPELLRRGRFDDLFFVDLPTLSERTEIFQIHLRRHGRDPLQFDLEELANHAARLSGAEIEQVVVAAMYSAFNDGRDLEFNDLADAITETVPIYDTYEDQIKELRDWARHRARPATHDAKVASYFGQRAKV